MYCLGKGLWLRRSWTARYVQCCLRHFRVLTTEAELLKGKYFLKRVERSTKFRSYTSSSSATYSSHAIFPVFSPTSPCNCSSLRLDCRCRNLARATTLRSSDAGPLVRCYDTRSKVVVVKKMAERRIRRCFVGGERRSMVGFSAVPDEG